MAEPPYSIEVDPDRLLVRATLRGLWKVETVERYAAEQKRVLAPLLANARSRVVKRLIDLREHGVQPREVVATIQTEMTRAVDLPALRNAVLVSPSALHKMQAQRIASTTTATFFADEAQAMAWLFGEGDAAA